MLLFWVKNLQDKSTKVLLKEKYISTDSNADYDFLKKEEKKYLLNLDLFLMEIMLLFSV